jgi:tRNA splicing ligase
MNIAPLDSLIDLEIYFQRKYKTTNNETIDYTNVKIGRDPKTCTNRLQKWGLITLNITEKNLIQT